MFDFIFSFIYFGGRSCDFLTALTPSFRAARRDSALVARARLTAATFGHFSTMIIYASIAFLSLGGFGVVVLQECALTRDTSSC